ncbi:MAG: DNA-processing protein DprA [Candidatus Zixiibacteriota bacterium]
MTVENIKNHDRIAKLVSILSTENIGIGTLYNLIEAFDNFDSIPFRNNAQIKKYLKPAQKEKFSGFNNIGEAEIQSQLEAMQKTDTRLLFLNDPDYPKLLRQIKSPPPFIFIRGELKSSDEIAIAMVGTRRLSSYGRQAAERLSSSLAASGITVVSGFAAGVDTISHKGAIESGGRTIAVLGCGMDVVYPASNRRLWQNFTDHGVMISPFLMGMPPLASNFPGRNRIISAMSLGVVVVEAPEKSGSLITARYALEQNREVFAVPGDINSDKSKGTNRLIQNGAKLIMNVDDILSEIGVVKTASNDKPKINLSELSENQVRIYESLNVRPIPIDTLSRKIGINPNMLLADLSIMELKGFVRQLPGKQFVRAL